MPIRAPVDRAVGLVQPDGGRAADIKTRTTFLVETDPTTRVRITGQFDNIDGQAGPYNGNWAAPQAGTIQTYQIQSIDRITEAVTGRLTLTGNFPDLEELFRDILYPAQGIRGAVSWSNVMPDRLPPLIFGNATQWEFLNLDGTRTVIFGRNFTYENGVPKGGFAEGISQFTADGQTEIWSSDFRTVDLVQDFPPSGIFAASNDLVLAGLFDVNLQQMYFGRLLAGVTGVTLEGRVTFDGDVFAPWFTGLASRGSNASEVLSGGLGNDSLEGLMGSDQISGLAGSDTLRGGQGNDRLDGGQGTDVLTGGSGADRFVFDLRPAFNQRDTITDFDASQDTIRLSRSDFAGIGPKGQLAFGAYAEGAGLTAARDSGDRIIYNTTNGALYFDRDGRGGDPAVRFATLLGGPDALSAADIFIF